MNNLQIYDCPCGAQISASTDQMFGTLIGQHREEHRTNPRPLPPLSATPCDVGEHDYQLVAHCTHGSRMGQALVCERCGRAGHRWSGYACGRPAKVIAKDRERCPIDARLAEQKQPATRVGGE